MSTHEYLISMENVEMPQFRYPRIRIPAAGQPFTQAETSLFTVFE